LASARSKRLGIDADELMRLWSAIVEMDANEISQLRRVCCPSCHGINHQRQYTPEGLIEAKRKHDGERAKILRYSGGDFDIGEFPEYDDAWYDKRKEPSSDCPECFGEGVGEVFFQDTRKLSLSARLIYGGVKTSKDGIEIIALSKEKAMDNLARALFLFKERDISVNITTFDQASLEATYVRGMQEAHRRQEEVLAERRALGLLDDGVS
jgi:hypothetical protein